MFNSAFNGFPSFRINIELSPPKTPLKPDLGLNSDSGFGSDSDIQDLSSDSNFSSKGAAKGGQSLLQTVMDLIMNLLKKMLDGDKENNDSGGDGGGGNAGGGGGGGGSAGDGAIGTPQFQAPAPQAQPQAPAPAPAANAPAPAPAGQAPAPQPQGQAPAPAPAGNKDAPAPAGEANAPAAQGGPTGAGNSVTFHNDGTTPMHVKFTPNAGNAEVPDMTLQPGETKTVGFPEGWGGNWRSTKGDGKAATLGEVKFQGDQGNTFYDDSRIEGSNMGETIAPTSGGRLTGTMTDLLKNAPDSVKAFDANGNAYGIKKSTINDVHQQEVIDFLAKYIGPGMGYKFPTDDASTAGTKDTHLDVHMADF